MHKFTLTYLENLFGSSVLMTNKHNNLVTEERALVTSQLPELYALLEESNIGFYSNCTTNHFGVRGTEGAIIMTIISYGNTCGERIVQKFTKSKRCINIYQTSEMYDIYTYVNLVVTVSKTETGVRMVIKRTFDKSTSITTITESVKFYEYNAQEMPDAFPVIEYIQLEKKLHFYLRRFMGVESLVEPASHYQMNLALPVNISESSRTFLSEKTDAICSLPEKFADKFRELKEIELGGAKEVLTTGASYGTLLFAVASAFDYFYNGNEESKHMALGSGIICAALFGPQLVDYISTIEFNTASYFQAGVVPKVIEDGFKMLLDATNNASMRKLKDYIYLITSFDKLKDGVKSIITWILEQIDWLSEKMMGRTVIPVSWYSNLEQKKEIISLINRIKKVGDDLLNDDLVYSSLTHAVIRDLRDECLDLRMNASKSKGSSSVLEKAYVDLVAIDKRFGNLGTMKEGTRVEPTCVFLTSTPGNCKSLITDALCKALVDSLDLEPPDLTQYVQSKYSANSKKEVVEKVTSSIYYHKFGTVYYDGYHNQPVTVIDEFGQMTDVPGQESIYSQFIDLKNTIPLPLNMSDIPDKGRTFFNSKYMILTSNLETISPKSIHDPVAVRRRIDFHVTVTVKREFCFPDQQSNGPRGRNIDFERLSKDANFLKMNFEILEFHLAKWSQQEREFIFDRVISLEELALLMKKRNHKYEQVYSSNKDTSDEFVLKMRSLSEFCGVDVDEEISSEPSLDIETFHPQYLRPFLYTVTARVGMMYGDISTSLKRFFKDQGMPAMEDIIAGCNFDRWSEIFVKYLPKINCSGEGLRDLVNSIRPDRYDYSKVREYVKENKKYFIAAATMAGLCGTALYFKNRAVIADPTHPQSPSLVKPGTNGPPKSIQELRRLYANEVSTAQMGIGDDPNGDLKSDSIIRNNFYSFIFEGKQRGSILFFMDNLALMPTHFLTLLHAWATDPVYEATTESEVTFRIGQETSRNFGTFKVTIRELLSGICYVPDMEDSELCIVRFPRRVGSKPNIIKDFKSKHEWRDVYNSTVLKMSFVQPDGTITIDQQRGQAYKVYNHALYDIDSTKKSIPVSYHMRFNTAAGHCGAMLFEMNRKVMNKIIGMHVSGNPQNHLAVSAPVCREWLEYAVSHIDESIEPLIQDKIMDKIHDSIEILGNETITTYQMREMPLQWQVVGLGKEVATMGRTTWQKSEMCGLFQEPTMFPAVLHPIKRDGVWKDPKAIALTGYGHHENYRISSELIQEIVSSEKDFINHTSNRQVEHKVLTLREAIVGLVEECDSGPISRKSSPGYPYVHVKQGTKGKQLWFGNEAEYCFDTPAYKLLETQLEKEITELEQGILPEFVFITNLKDELRPLKKVLDVATRNFSACPLNLVLLCKMYFGTMVVDTIKNRIHNGATIGINPYSNEWDILARKLLSLNNEVNAGDFKGFDKHQVPQIVSESFPVVAAYYRDQSPKEMKVRRLLWTTLHRTYQLVGSKVVLWDSSLPSGHYLTAWWNSLYNRIVHKYAFYRSMADKLNMGYESLWIFNEKVCLQTHGDDSLFTIDKEYAPLFNEMNIGEYMLELGLTYTPEDKMTENVKARGISEVAFLKRKFVYSKLLGGFVAPMNLTRVKEMINWTRKENANGILQDKCDVVAREFSLHGRIIAEPLIEKLNQSYKRVFGEGMKVTSFLTLFREVCSSDITSDISNLQMMNSTTKKITDQALDGVIAAIQLKTNMHTTSSLKDGRVITSLGELHSLYQMESTVTTSAPGPVPQDTAFADEAAVINVQKPLQVSSARLNNDFKGSQNLDSLKHFLERPVIQATGTFATTDVVSTFTAFDFCDIITLNSMYADKLKGVTGFKGDLVITLQVNADPMQQGLYAIYAIPTGGASDSTILQKYALMHAYSKCQISQLPHVKCNIACDTSVSITLPFISAFNSVVPNATVSSFVNPYIFRIYPFKALSTGTSGSTTAAYTIWTQFLNVEVGAATYPQSKGGARKKKIDFLTQEQQSEGTVSKALRFGGEVSATLAQVPLLSAIAGPVSTVLNGAAGVARYFGFSKPNLVDKPHRVTDRLLPYMGASDGHDLAEPLCVSIENHVELAPDLTGSLLDEMSIDFFKQIPAYQVQFDMTTAQAAGTSIMKRSLDPVTWPLTANDGAVPLINFQPVALLTRLHSYWTGSLKFKFDIVKTKFHSGRIMVVVNYFDPLVSTPTYSLTKSDYNLRQIIDLRDTDTFEVTVPYVKKSPWCDTTGSDRYGEIMILILDPLVGPATVSTTITFYMEVCGGPDFAVATPKSFNTLSTTYIPTVPSAYQMDSECIAVNKVMGDLKINDDIATKCSVTQGEMITSLRQLVKRTNVMNPATVGYTAGKTLSVLPFANGYLNSNGVVIAGDIYSSTVDLYSLFSSIYAFSRGGVRLSFLPNETNGTFVRSYSRGHCDTATTMYTPWVEATGSYSDFICRHANDPMTHETCSKMMSVFCPQQSQGFSRISANNFTDAVTPLNFSAGYYPAFSYVEIARSSAASTDSLRLLRSGADDCSFSCFVSIPPMRALASGL